MSSVRSPAKLAGPARPGNFSSDFNVRISDLDVNLHTNNVNYIKWTIDAYDFDFMLKHVPSSVEINYLAESHFNDRVAIMIAGQEGNERISDHSIVRTDDDTELCRVRIQWSEKQA